MRHIFSKLVIRGNFLNIKGMYKNTPANIADTRQFSKSRKKDMEIQKQETDCHYSQTSQWSG